MPCPSFLSFPSATSSSHTPAGWPGGGVMPPIRDVLLPWLRPDSSSRRISLSRFLNALYACFRSSSVAISRSPGDLFDMRPYRSGYRGSCTHENRIVRYCGDFSSSSSPHPTTEPADRSSLVDLLEFCAGMLENLQGSPGLGIPGTGRRRQLSKQNWVLAPTSHMSRYNVWNKPRSWEEPAFNEKAYSFKDMARWDAKWQTLTPRARLAYLKDVKGLNRAQGPHRDRPSVKADLFVPNVLEELLAAGFAELGSSGSGKPRDRVFAVAAATDFMARVRALYRHHLLRGDLPSLLETHVRHAFYQTVDVELSSVIRDAGIDEYLSLDGMLKLYVVGHRWPGWVARSLKNPNAERIIELLRNANGPVGRALLVEKLPDIDADALQAALGSLFAHLAVFEDLDPETFELVVGFLPSVRASMAAALLPRERPPLVVSENLESIGTEGSIIVDDLRAFLLEVVAEPPRLRQDDQIFQNDLDRFLEALAELPSSLMHALGLTQEKRLKQAQDWAQGLKLVGKRSSRSKDGSRSCPGAVNGSRAVSRSNTDWFISSYDHFPQTEATLTRAPCTSRASTGCTVMARATTDSWEST